MFVRQSATFRASSTTSWSEHVAPKMERAQKGRRIPPACTRTGQVVAVRILPYRCGRAVGPPVPCPLVCPVGDVPTGFVGRDDHRSVLGQMARHVEGGHPGLVVTKGEAGIGKTWLLDWFRADRALLRVP